MTAVISVLLAFCLGLHGAVALTLEEQNDELWQQLEKGPELNLDETHALLKQIVQGLTEECRRVRDNDSPDNTGFQDLQKSRMAVPRLERAKHLLNIAEYSQTGCGYHSIMKMRATYELMTGPSATHYTKHHYLGKIKSCEPILSASLARTAEKLAIGQQLEGLKSKILATDRISDALADYLDPLATNDKDLIKKDSFKKLYSLQVVDLCRKVTEIEVLDTYRVIDESPVDGIEQSIRDWVKVYKGCKDIVQDAGDRKMQFILKHTQEKLLEMRSLTMKRTLAEKVFGCGLNKQS